jgi:uncharacterized protein
LETGVFLLNFIYNGTDITADVQPIKLLLIDNAGGVPDSISAVFSDTQGLWGRWRPAKNDTIQAMVDGYDTGLMYIDHLSQQSGRFEIKVLSIPQTAKTARSQSWEDVRFLEFAAEIAGRHGFQLQTFGITNHLYRRVDQDEEADFAFLAYRSALEGYALKASGRTLIIYGERAEEERAINEKESTIYQVDMIGGFHFIDKSTDIYSKCIVRSGMMRGEFSDVSVNGPALTKNIAVSDHGEAQRFAKGILRSLNKYAITGRFTTELKPKFAAGSNVMIRGIGLFDGRYFVHRITHDIINQRTEFQVRRPLNY